jgi:GT2 family glycosyltransferase
MRPDVSIVIPTYNRARHLERALRALEQQDVPLGTFEVIAVDDGSTDDTPAVLSMAWAYPLRSFRQENGGPAAARNLGIGEAAAPLILFIDDDVIPAPDLVRQHQAAQSRNPGVVTGRMLRPHESRIPAWAEWETRTLERQYGEMSAGLWVPTPRQFYTANASVPREALLRVGSFDERFRRAEDVELAYRLRDATIPFHFAPTAVVAHATPRTLDGWMRMARQYGMYDVVMTRDLGRREVLDAMAWEFHRRRKPLVRAMARLFVGRRLAMIAIAALSAPAIRATDIASRRASLAVCSIVYNLLYWDAIAREGGRAMFWQEIAAVAPAADVAKAEAK